MSFRQVYVALQIQQGKKIGLYYIKLKDALMNSLDGRKIVKVSKSDMELILKLCRNFKKQQKEHNMIEK